MNDLKRLLRQAKLAQEISKRGGSLRSAATMAKIAEMLALEAGVDRAVVLQFTPRAAAHRAGTDPSAVRLGPEGASLVPFPRREHSRE